MDPFTELYLAYLRIKNKFDFPLRQRLRFRSAPVITSAPNSTDLIGTYPKKERGIVQQIIDRLDRQYHFQDFKTIHSIDEIRENYYYLAMLDETFQRCDLHLPESITAADIGPSSWFYVHALSSALTWYDTKIPRHIQLTGFEVDAYRLYSDFHTRKDHALGNIQGLKNVTYLDQQFTQQSGAYNIITLFFPFVFEKDHLKWGLPNHLFNPAVLLNAAINSLRPGGLLMIVNQGEEEHHAEISLLNKAHIAIKTTFRVEPLLYSYPLERYIIAATHEF